MIIIINHKYFDKDENEGECFSIIIKRNKYNKNNKFM